MKASDMNHNPTSKVCYWWRCHCTHHYFYIIWMYQIMVVLVTLQHIFRLWIQHHGW